MQQIRAMWVAAAAMVLVTSGAALAQPIGNVRITAMTAYDQGQSSGAGDLAIDVVQEVCNAKSDPVLKEKFYETLLALTISNHSNIFVRFEHVRISIPRFARKRPFRSRLLAPVSIAEVPAGKEQQILALFTSIKGDKKYIAPSKDPIDPATGIRNVMVDLYGRYAGGQPVHLVGRTAFVFRDVDRCQQ